jgi:hypothetical protein
LQHVGFFNSSRVFANQVFSSPPMAAVKPVFSPDLVDVPTGKRR